MTLIQLLFFCGLFGLGSSWSQSIDVNTCYVTEITLHKGSYGNPATSCNDIAQTCDSPSGEYWIQNNNTNSPVQVYCDMTRTCCNTTGGWTRVANLDMTDPSQQCPDGFKLVNRTTAPLRTCGRPGPAGCVSTTFPVHGIEYSQVCGRIRGYQFGTTEAFKHNSLPSPGIDDNYVNGVSLTHGQSPRQHIWTFAAAKSELTPNTASLCPCTRPSITYVGTIPEYVGNDYFCETGDRGFDSTQFIFLADDPLWDGQGCGGTSTCCSFNNPPWFCKDLPQPTTHDIKLRLCSDQYINNEETPLKTFHNNTVNKQNPLPTSLPSITTKYNTCKKIFYLPPTHASVTHVFSSDTVK